MSAHLVAIRRQPRTLSELIEDFHQEHEQALTAAVRTVEHAIRAGEALLEAKAQIEHGEWTHWLEENILGKGRSLSTVNAYMRFARNQELLRREQPDSFKGADLLLKGAPDARINPHLRDEARGLKAQGLTHAQIAEHLGVSKPSVWRMVNPESYKASVRRSHQRSMAAKVALRRQERDAAVRANGGNLAEAYSLIRKALQQLDTAAGEAGDREVKRAISSAIHRLHNVEDQIVRAVRLS